MAAVTIPRLDALPEELISNIVAKLDSDSSFAFRLTCRALESRSLHEWATEYFVHQAIIPSSGSLKVLVSISDSRKLRDYVHHIYIVPALFSRRNLKCCHGFSCKTKTVRQKEAMHGYVEDQKRLKQGNTLEERLTYVFKHLTKVRSISFADSLSTIPAEIDIHGYRSFSRRTNNTPVLRALYGRKDKEFFAWKACVWKAMMQAIAFSEISTLEGLSTSLNKADNPLTLSDLHFNGRTLHHLNKTLRNVKAVSLQFTDHSESTGKETRFDKAKAIRVMKDTAKLLPSIESLDLTFSYSAPSFVMCQTFTDNIALSKLHRLRLDGVFLGSKFLGTLICALVNVNSIFLEYIQLTKGKWPTILEAMVKLKKLKHLHLTYVGEPAGYATFLKPLKNDNRAGADVGPWGHLPAFGTGPAQGGAAPGPAGNSNIDGFDDSDFATDDEEYDDDLEGEDDSDDSMPDLEPQSGTVQAQTPAQSAQPVQSPTGPSAAPTLSQVLSNLYSDSDGETDDSMPELEPQTGPTSTQAATQPASSTNIADGNHTPNHGHNHGPSNAMKAALDPESLENRLGRGAERGRVICLNTAKEIQEYLPRFIKDYRITDMDDEEDDAMFGGMAIPVAAGPQAANGGGAGAGAGIGLGAGAAGAGAAPPPGMVALLNSMFPLQNGPNIANGPGITFTGPFYGPPPPPATGHAHAGGAGDAGDWTDEE